MNSELIESVVDLARNIPSTQVRVVAKRLLDGQPLETACDSVGDAANRKALLETAAAWQVAGVAMESLATALLASSQTAEAARLEEQLELVWTGPVASRPTMRRTEQALLELIESARRELLLVSFVTYEVPSIRSALRAAIDRGVKVTLLAESTEHNDTVTDQHPLRLVGNEYAHRMTVLIWASEARSAFTQNRPGKLHAKFAIADRRRALLGSANLTDAALSRNIEAGVMITGGRVPNALCAEIDRLRAERAIAEWRRR